MTISSRRLRQRRTLLVHAIYLPVIIALAVAMLIPMHRLRVISLKAPQIAPLIPPYGGKMVTIAPSNVTITNFARDLSLQTGVRVLVTWTPYPKSDYDPDHTTLIISNGGQMRFEEALRIFSGSVRVAYEQEQVVIGPDEAIHSPARCETVVYPLGDFQEVNDPDRGEDSAESRMRALTTLVQDTVTPGYWIEQGAELGAIHVVGDALVVTNTPDAQYQVAALLAALRAAK